MIYLASTSPRRRALLREAGMRYRVLKPDYREVRVRGLAVRELVRRHALGKALSAARRLRRGTVLGADTVVLLRGRLLGKPRSLRHADRMLAGLEGRLHEVLTAVALVRVEKGVPVSRRVFSVTSTVRLRRLGPERRKAYLRRIRPLDKAGAYAAQARGVSSPVESVRDSIFASLT